MDWLKVSALVACLAVIFLLEFGAVVSGHDDVASVKDGIEAIQIRNARIGRHMTIFQDAPPSSVSCEGVCDKALQDAFMARCVPVPSAICCKELRQNGGSQVNQCLTQCNDVVSGMACNLAPFNGFEIFETCGLSLPIC